MRSFIAGVVVCLGLTSCEVEQGQVQEAQAEDLALMTQPQLFWTCGDPVCSGWTNKGLKKCGNHQAGASRSARPAAAAPDFRRLPAELRPRTAPTIVAAHHPTPR